MMRIIQRSSLVHVLLYLLVASKSKASAGHNQDPVLIASILHRSPAPSPPFTLASCVVFKDEGAYLAEWLWYHILVGFEHFYMYDNGSERNETAVLRPFVEKGYVTLHQHPTLPGELNGQGRMLKDCFTEGSAPMSQSKWLTNHDIDEFPVFEGATPSISLAHRLEPFSSHTLLARFAAEGVGAITVDRISFDTNGRVTKNYLDPNASGLVIQDYTTFHIPPIGWKMQGKIFQRTSALSSCEDQLNRKLYDESCDPTAHTVQGFVCCVLPSHETILKSGFRNVLANGETWFRDSLWGVFSPLVIFHYEKKSWDECVAKLNPEYNSGWRAREGIRFCEQAAEGKPNYVPEQHARTMQLASSSFTEVLQHLLVRDVPRPHDGQQL